MQTYFLYLPKMQLPNVNIDLKKARMLTYFYSYG